MSYDPDLLALFRVEAAESVDALAQHLEALARNEGDLHGHLTGSMRLLHNLKGSARVVGIDPIVSTLHAIEEILAPYRKQGTVPPESLVRQIVQALGRIEEFTSPAEEQAAPDPLPNPGPQPATSRDNVRVEVARLDDLMGHTGQLLVTQARQQRRSDMLNSFAEAFTDAVRHIPASHRRALEPLIRDIEQIVQHDREEVRSLGYLTEEISAAMKRLRMTPLEGSASRWRQTVRKASEEAVRRVRLSLEVAGIELDKRILDGLQEPLMHLLRNAVGHGIEPEAERVAAGKSPEGLVRLRATLQGDRVLIEVSDDGRGLDLARVSKVALERGLASAGELDQMTPHQLAEFIFAPGFSTATSVTQLSGRGVGMDVVRQHVEELGGSVEVLPGATGTTFHLSVPISLVSTRGLLVRVEDSILALPIAHIERVLRVRRSDVRGVAGGTAIKLDGDRPVTLRWMAGLLGFERHPDPDHLSIVVVVHQATPRAGRRRGPGRRGLRDAAIPLEHQADLGRKRGCHPGRREAGHRHRSCAAIPEPPPGG